jgi:Protein kinase domain/Ankyrin repeats (many copies)
MTWKLTDFGFTSEAMSTAKTTLYARGTPGYRAPELFSDQKPQFSNRSDIWALGCILHELSTGRSVFANDYETYRFTSGTLKLSIDLPYGDQEFWQHHVSKFLHDLLSKKAHERPTAAQVSLRTSVYSSVHSIILGRPEFQLGALKSPGYLPYDEWNGLMLRCSTAAEGLFSLALEHLRQEQEIYRLLIRATILEAFEDETSSRVEVGFWIKNGILWRKIGVELDAKGDYDLSLLVFKNLRRNNPTMVQDSIEKAVACGDLFSIKSLFALGSPINDSDGASGSMGSAAAAGHVDAIQLLASLGGNLDGPNDHPVYLTWDYWRTWRTPMHRAVVAGRTEAIRVLAELGADVNARELGQTPMHLAATGGDVHIIRELIKLGGDVNAMDGMSRVPLFYAELRQNIHAVEVLKELQWTF